MHPLSISVPHGVRLDRGIEYLCTHLCQCVSCSLLLLRRLTRDSNALASSFVTFLSIQQQKLLSSWNKLLVTMLYARRILTTGLTISHMLVDDKDRSGRPPISTTLENVAKFTSQCMKTTGRWTIHICGIVGLSYGTCQQILSDELNMRAAANCVPRLPCDDRKQQHGFFIMTTRWPTHLLLWRTLWHPTWQSSATFPYRQT